VTEELVLTQDNSGRAATDNSARQSAKVVLNLSTYMYIVLDTVKDFPPLSPTCACSRTVCDNPALYL
jgi:hypothetical protein